MDIFKDKGGLAPNATVMSWRGENEPLSAAWGGTVDLKKTYSYNPLPVGIPAEKQKHVIGVQANLWGEVIHLENDVDYMAFPRGLAVAEIAWSPQESTSYDYFLQRLPARLADLDRRGVTFRIPEAIGEVKTEAGNAVISLEPLVEGADIYYSTDGSNPLVHGKMMTEQIVLPYGRSSAIYTLNGQL